MSTGAPAFDAVVLAGGSARRLGGQDKASLVVGGSTLLDRVLDACSEALRIVVVGPSRPTSRAVSWVREEPAGGGPVPALRAGLEKVTTERVAVLAADLPFLTSDVLRVLVDRSPAVLSDGSREQWLCGAWDSDRLRAAAQGAGPRLRDLLLPLRPVVVRWEGEGTPWFDCDTAEELAAARDSV
ncbi:MAG: molybdopterin-guanine dinucleotide biosynthesis protein [Frankiales bacterium]|nr:molybdopterin-guanine dinucleotide biosynthesis protein [Frankiales bacterium]